MKTQGGDCSFSACMEAYLTEAKDRATRTERLKVELVIQIDDVVAVEPKIKLQVKVEYSSNICIDI